MILVDTGAWFSRFVPDDPQHAQMLKWFASNSEPLLTTDYCIDETLTLLNVRKRPKLAIEAGVLLFDESMAKIHFLNRNQIERAWILFQQRANAGWSFTDCTSKVVIGDLDIQGAASLDEHFRQFGVALFP
jgi:predicted nucleic acid-binding protein